jgi:4-alpha-glucanotransferase
MVRAAMMSIADTAVIPMQDYLEKGSEARINIPSTLGDNWKWRLDRGDLQDALAYEIRDLTGLYGRLR